MKTRTAAFWGITGGVLASFCGCSLCSGQLVTQPPAKAPNPADHIPIAPVQPPTPAPHMDFTPPAKWHNAPVPVAPSTGAK